MTFTSPLKRCAVLATLFSVVCGFTTRSRHSLNRVVHMSGSDATYTPSPLTGLNRRSFLDVHTFTAVVSGAVAIAANAGSARAEEIAGTDLKYKVLNPGKGLKPSRGDLAAIRFAGYYNGIAFDDILQAEEPLYFRVGDGRLLKGIETAIVNMPVGAKWELDIPPELAFGKGGRPASPGKPRIPAGARVQYVLELAGLPGKEEDLMEVIGDFN